MATELMLSRAEDSDSVKSVKVSCTDSEVKVCNPDSVKNVKVRCAGSEDKGCKRWLDNTTGLFAFQKIDCPALKKSSFLDPVKKQFTNPRFCVVCEPSQLEIAYTQHANTTNKTCCRRWFELKDLADFCDESGNKKFNPIWTGQDQDQIGVFIRNLKIEAVDEEEQSISIHFVLNLVWLDPDLCKLVKEEKFKERKDQWFIQMSAKEYKEVFEKVHRDRADLELPTTQEKSHNALPNVKIWNASTVNGYEVREEVISLNKKHIGEDTVYWRRIMRVKLNCEYTSRSFPFGYETFKMSIRLMSRTDQHLALLRTKLWWDAHFYQCEDQLLVDHTFAYVHPDNKGLKDWKICSVHDNKDRFYSPFDNNDLSFRLPVRVSDGKDTQSRYEALIILKRQPRFVLWNIWVYFALTSMVALLTYLLDPANDQADRLAIAVAIIFVQMGLKWDSGRKTPRVKYVTCLDYHVFSSLSLVVFQAVGQMIISYAYKEEEEEEKGLDNLNRMNRILFIINAIGVVIENSGILFWAKRRQHWKRLSLEEMLCKFTGFNDYPIGDHKPKDIGGALRIRGKRDDDPLQKSSTEVELFRVSRRTNCAVAVGVKGLP